MSDWKKSWAPGYCHPTAVIDPRVVLGVGVHIGPFAVILGQTIIGDHCMISGHSVIGSAAEKHGFFDSDKGQVVLGNHVRVREFCTINGGTFRATRVEDHVVMLRGSHVGHDALIEPHVTLSCNALIGGEAVIMERANMGLGSIVHQACVVGPLAMVGMGSVVTKKNEDRAL